MSMLIVGLMLVAALHTIGASKVSQSKNGEQALGPMLARDLMTEILNQSYQEPVDTVAFGLETGESASVRTDWDDVDDYDGWSAVPPQNKDGSAVPGAAGWTRTVSVAWTDPYDLNNTSATTTGVKRIDVKVLHHGRTIATLTSLRTTGWPAEGVAAEQESAQAQSGGEAPTSGSSSSGTKSFFQSLFK